MDQMFSIDRNQLPVRLDQNNNDSGGNKVNTCSCTNISIMQLFHEMKQEFPKVPDHIVQQLVAENCHNRRACLEQLQKVAFTSTNTPTMYPSKSIHSQQTPRSPLLNGVKWSNNKRMRELSEKFESTSINFSSSSSSSSTSEMTSPTSTNTSNEMKIKRPTTLPLRRAPDPPATKIKSAAAVSSDSPSTSTSVSSISSPISHQHHNVTLDSTASKINDSLNVQLNVTVSPISSKSPIIARRPAPPPPPSKPSPSNRYTSQLSVQPEPPFTSMLDQAKNSNSSNNINQNSIAATASTGTSASGKKSFTKVNFTLRQPTSIIPSPQTPIEIQAGPQSLTYSSTSFNAKQGYESHLTITVAGNGESCIQAVRTLPPSSSNELNQIDTTINIEGSNCDSNDDINPPIRIVSTPYTQFGLPHLTQHQQNDYQLIDDTKLRLRIQRQIKQKQSLKYELDKESEKLEMIRLDIKTLTSPCMTHAEMKELCDEITRLRSVCERLTDEIDVMTETTPVRSPIPPIPRELRSRRGYSPNLPQLDTSGIRYPSSQPPPPSYNEVMMSSPSTTSTTTTTTRSMMIQPADDEKWTCSMCTFRNHSLLQICEACELPKVEGIKITSSSYRPLLQNNQLQRAATNNDNVATAL